MDSEQWKEDTVREIYKWAGKKMERGQRDLQHRKAHEDSNLLPQTKDKKKYDDQTRSDNPAVQV